jgi:hypothetical protein
MKKVLSAMSSLNELSFRHSDSEPYIHIKQINFCLNLNEFENLHCCYPRPWQANKRYILFMNEKLISLF